MNERILGVFVPPPLIDGIERSPSPEEAGVEMALELIQKVKSLPGVSGIRVMCLGRESLLPRLLELVEQGARATTREDLELSHS